MKTEVQKRHTKQGDQDMISKNVTAVQKNEDSAKEDDGTKFVHVPFTLFYLKESIALAYLLSLLFNISFFMQLMFFPYVAKGLQVSDTEFGKGYL